MEGLAANNLLWLAVINTLVLLIFALSFARPRHRRDWRSWGVFPAFIVALFTEMYGFPLTIYLLSGWLANRYPDIDPFAYSAGQLWHTLFGLTGAALRYSVHLLGYVLVAGGFILIAYARRILYEAQRNPQLTHAGPYAYVRHPQYVGFMLVMLGLLLTWPALSTLIMFPILTIIYVRLARSEEWEALAEFGDEYRRYMATTPAFFPRLNRVIRESERKP
jgi:protein-S-isoprenylcysteine O-methyltransferase Ste14